MKLQVLAAWLGMAAACSVCVAVCRVRFCFLPRRPRLTRSVPIAIKTGSGTGGVVLQSGLVSSAVSSAIAAHLHFIDFSSRPFAWSVIWPADGFAVGRRPGYG